MNDFYGDWIFYGTFVGALGVAITIAIYGKIIGANNLNWKHYSIIITLFAFPTIILPILLAPIFSLYEKIGVTIGLILFGVARYFVTTKAQEAVAERREREKKKRDKSEEQS